MRGAREREREGKRERERELQNNVKTETQVSFISGRVQKFLVPYKSSTKWTSNLLLLSGGEDWLVNV